jgi:hypothetical protein
VHAGAGHDPQELSTFIDDLERRLGGKNQVDRLEKRIPLLYHDLVEGRLDKTA